MNLITLSASLGRLLIDKVMANDYQVYAEVQYEVVAQST